ncbi:family 16 glycosylhydrolase [Motilibacter sp. E257]|uniref:Family 16 glycosylhydrolase n=1 Tax=Motilibacter deserti TaxID=2714956 RepID=A0ABX0GUI2_9ACTN|nr:family 16 glycosylhydrolase [Motilibacter deserti]
MSAALATAYAPGTQRADLSAVIDWGDGTTSPGFLAGPREAWGIFGTHSYATSGVFRATVRLSGPDGSSAVTTTAVTVRAASGPAFTTVWADDFNGPAGQLPSAENWIFDIGTQYPGGPPQWGTGEIETMTDDPANVSTDGQGNLRITPIRGAGGQWTSARIETRRSDFEPPAGGVLRFEGRIRLPDVTGPAAQGIWPAFWSLGAPFRGTLDWPRVGEIDILENVNGANQVWGTLHCGTAPGGPCNEFNGLSGTRPMGQPSLQSAFHTYALEWDRSSALEELRWYVDGIQYFSIRQDQLPAQTWQNAFSHGYFLILNVAIGGGWPGLPTAATASGIPMIVDYVAVYTRPGS